MHLRRWNPCRSVFIRGCLPDKYCLDRISGKSIDVALITLRGLESSNVFRRRLDAAFSSALNCLVQGCIHVRRHPTGIAADIKMRALLEPSEDFLGVFEQ